MRIGIVGAGFWTRFQIAGWLELPDVEITSIANRTVERAKRLADQFGVRSVYQDPAEMIAAEDLDCVDIITGVEGHAAAVSMAAREGVSVICQKPMASTLEEAEAMVQECERLGVPFMIHENWRYQAPIQAVAGVLRKGTIGDPFRARIQFSCSFPVFDNQPALRALRQFILTDIGSHILDVARFLFGEAQELMCRTAQVSSGIAGEDVATAVMRMDRCPMVTCEMSYASRLSDQVYPETYIVVEGSKGTIELGKRKQLLVTTAAGTIHSTVTPPSFPWMDPKYDLVHASIVECNRALLAAFADMSKAATSGADNLKTVRLVFGCYESAEKNVTLRFDSKGERSTK